MSNLNPDLIATPAFTSLVASAVADRLGLSANAARRMHAANWTIGRSQTR